MDAIDRDRPLSLYIHIPFCHRKCSYCAFYSVPSPSEEDIDRCIDIEVARIKEAAADYGKAFYTVFIGGGNPGIIGRRRLERLLDAAFINGDPKECTSEINPEDIDSSFMAIDRISRVSVGIQSMDEAVLSRLGRNASVQDNMRALSLLAQSGKEFNADIITAVPGQSIENAIRDIDTVAGFGPGHISCYALTFEEGTPLAEREKPLGDDLEADFLLSAWQRLKELGYRHYEVSNFALPGHECLHNSVYWKLGQYIGIGPSAESSLGWNPVVSLREAESVEAYISGAKGRGDILTAEEAEEEFLLTGLRTIDGIDKEEYSSRFSLDFDERYQEAISKLDDELFINSTSRFSLTEKGFMLLDAIILKMILSF